MSSTRDVQWLKDTMFALDRVFFEDELADNLTIRWMTRADVRREFNYGFYYRQENLIELHPSLAHDWVPDYVPTGIVYHEMLHAKLTDEHDALFNLALKAYPHDKEMELWCWLNQEKLIASKPPAWKDRR